MYTMSGLHYLKQYLIKSETLSRLSRVATPSDRIVDGRLSCVESRLQFSAHLINRTTSLSV